MNRERGTLKPCKIGLEQRISGLTAAVKRGPRRWPVPGVVLVSGLVLMVMEIAGGPMLAPYFGSTVFIWVAIISVFMLGLSLGYFLGGLAASRGWSLNNLAGLLATAAVWLLLAGGLGSRTLGVLVPSQIAPLAAFLLLLADTALLFLFPITVIGMITPLAIVAAGGEPERPGTRVGRVFTWSTLGSLSGALAAIFLLPLFAGQTMILCGSGTLLALTAGLTLLTPAAPFTTPSKTEQVENGSLTSQWSNSDQDDQDFFTTNPPSSRQGRFGFNLIVRIFKSLFFPLYKRGKRGCCVKRMEPKYSPFQRGDRGDFPGLISTYYPKYSDFKSTSMRQGRDYVEAGTPTHEIERAPQKPLSLRAFAVNSRARLSNADQPSLSPDHSVLMLFALVFAGGAAVMVLEIIGGAWLALYFGGSLYVWGATITLFLVCMALGYRLGGLLADHAPDFRLLGGLIAAAAVLISLIPLTAPRVGQALLPWQHHSASGLFLAAPFLAGLVLFSLPALALAMVSPFCVRLATGNAKESGPSAGRILALSTLGSVLGVLGADLLLLADIGKADLIAGTGAVLAAVALAVVALQDARPFKKKPWAMLTTVSLAMIILPAIPQPEPVSLAGFDESMAGTCQGWSIVQLKEVPDCVVLRRLRATAESPYHHLAVVDEKALQPGSVVRADDGRSWPVAFSAVNGDNRSLLFDCFPQSAVLLGPDAATLRVPYQSGALYSDLLHLPFLLHPEIRDVLIIGGGGGVGAMLLKQAYPVTMDVVEIDPAVVAMAYTWFGLKPDNRLRVHVADGRMFLRESAKDYDLIVLDAYSAGGRIPFHLTTREFFEEIRVRLRPDGLMIMNLISGVDGKQGRLFRSVFKTLSATFGRERVTVFPLAFMPEWDRHEPRNLFLLAGDRISRFTSRPAELLQGASESGWRARAPWLKAVIPFQLGAEDPALELSEQSLMLSDDFAPVDLLAAGLGMDDP